MVTDLSITNSVPPRVIVPLAILSAKVIVPPLLIAFNASLKLITPSLAIVSSVVSTSIFKRMGAGASNAPISVPNPKVRSTSL